MASFWERLMTGIKAFREAYMIAGTLDDAAYGDFDSRRVRYDILWSFFENTAYRNVHAWAIRYKTEYGLYKYTRNIYNPSYRLGEFYRTHLMGGALDPAAGSGLTAPTALPIVTENEQLRPALAALWRDSNWAFNKDIYGLWGAVMGDVGLRVIDDVERKKVYLKVVHAGTVKTVTTDDFGNIKGYAIEETRNDPRPGKTGKVAYGEIAERDGEDVVYRTLLDGKEWAWDGESAEWRVPYGFVPLVMVQHNNVGLSWGWSELYPCLSKIREVDDIAAKLSDQIRKMVDVPWLFIGMDKPKSQPLTRGDVARVSDMEPGREEIPALYVSNASASAQPLIAPLDITATVAHLTKMLEELEREYPELQMDIWASADRTSGRALRTARQRTTTKVSARRAMYNDGLTRAQSMAMAIGGWRKYAGYEGLGLDSFVAGKLAHTIGARPVFEPDPLDKIEEEKAFWDAALVAKNAGMPLTVYLARCGWPDGEIRAVTDSPEYQARMALMNAGVNGLGGGG